MLIVAGTDALPSEKTCGTTMTLAAGCIRRATPATAAAQSRDAAIGVVVKIGLQLLLTCYYVRYYSYAPAGPHHGGPCS
jgi:hypothetical protein